MDYFRICKKYTDEINKVSLMYNKIINTMKDNLTEEESRFLEQMTTDYICTLQQRMKKTYEAIQSLDRFVKEEKSKS